MIAVTLWMATKMTTMTMIFVEKLSDEDKAVGKDRPPHITKQPPIADDDESMTRMMPMTTLMQNLFRDGPESPYHGAPTFTDGRSDQYSFWKS